MGQQIFAAADCRPNKMPDPIMPEELACSMCFIVKQQSLEIISDVPEGAVRDHFVIERHHNGRAAEAVVALVLGVTESWICLSWGKLSATARIEAWAFATSLDQ